MSTVTRSVDKLSFWLDYYLNHSMTQHQYEWLMDPTPFPQSVAYDINQQIIASGRSMESMNIARDIVVSGTEGKMTSFEPFIKYPAEKVSEYKSNYPALTKYLQNDFESLYTANNVLSSLVNFTGLSEDRIKNELKWDQGIELRIIDFDNDGISKTSSSSTLAYFNDKHPNAIFFNEDWASKLNTGPVNQMQAESLSFLLGVVILHEFVHWGDYQNGNKYVFPAAASFDEGDLFEIEAFGKDITNSNYEEVYFNYVPKN